MRKSWDSLWKWLRSAWDWFRHLKAFRDLLEVLTVWKYIMLGIALPAGVVTSIFSWIWSLPGPVIFVLGLAATVLMLWGSSLIIGMRARRIAIPQQIEGGGEEQTQKGRPPRLVLALFGLLAVLAGIGFFVPRKVTTLDAISQIEAKLADVPDPAYRQLLAAVIYSFEPKASLSVGSLEPTPDGTRSVDVEIRSVRDGKPMLAAIDIVNAPPGKAVGIAAVDSADSKRLDIKADAMFLCSDSGFDEEAINKAK